MSAALKSVHDLPPAEVDVSRVLGLVVFVEGSLSGAGLSPLQLWQDLSGTPFGHRLARCRLSGDTHWQDIEEALALAEHRGRDANGELVFNGVLLATKDAGAAPWVEFADRGPVLGMKRASHLLFRFAEGTGTDELAALSTWVLNHVPFLWGTAGWFFHAGKGPPAAVARRLSGLAKRFWGVQLLDTTALQWDSLDGMPGVNWMNLVGHGFAVKSGTTIELLAAQASALRQRAVFHRSGRHGAAFAAGPQPLLGDINADERMDALVQVTRLLQPMLLASLAPMAGVLAKPEVLCAWLNRFSEPQAWLDCDIHAE